MQGAAGGRRCILFSLVFSIIKSVRLVGGGGSIGFYPWMVISRPANLFRGMLRQFGLRREPCGVQAGCRF